jgi:hypothetical protein
MSRPATTRLKVNPPLGRLPVLQFVPPSELQIDATYQRSLEASNSQTLIRKIAQFWNWDLCQPLVVARRAGGELFVIDGQHRLEAARLRGDIGQMPCVVVEYASAADEAASFVHLNQQRRPLTKLDIFKAAVASQDPEAVAIVAALNGAGLTVAPHSNHTAWKPGMVSNVAGIEAAWRKHGPAISAAAMKVISKAFAGQVLRYAGTIWPGVVAIIAKERAAKSGRDPQQLIEMLKEKSQQSWRSAVMRFKADDPNIRYSEAVERALLSVWDGLEPPKAEPARSHRVVKMQPIAAQADGKQWCTQCEARVSLSAATLCKDRFCKVRPRLRA